MVSHVESVIRDFKSLSDYMRLKKDNDEDGQKIVFRNFSWDDNRVADHLSVYLKDTKSQEEIEKSFMKIFPYHISIGDHQLATMVLWVKARIHMLKN
ncbi:hypothetical protein BMR1_03g01255 [Babesia microti strain RI]|uniref:ATPTG10-like domain-containing protein n=1 Tax=Babesia microti (strain RI) TaxID=1133968 RepID=A0A0K3AQW4_BABMR|nr:hypothetical protein BMR1_03g01255 [Babesia microti strain RI]CTQ40850.1 hypothetical protein BMR1_03g01255 [Babesia microti strain RI]|eukprot:XP_012648861.1 hypothetical protein BMR1_03g01255 [Babesia microti strain RI]